MKHEELIIQAEALAEAIKNAPQEDKLDLHQQLHCKLQTIKTEGGNVPASLKTFDMELLDEEVEALFDNMPV